MSRKHLFVAPMALVMALGAGSNALAGGLVATLASPTLKQEQILDGTIWRCVETTCRSVSQPKDTGVLACKDIAKKFGQIVSFMTDDKALDDESLARCNQSAK